ncbi:MAG: PolC-type DNA polymerase III [Thermomicrobium sp.]
MSEQNGWRTRLSGLVRQLGFEADNRRLLEVRYTVLDAEMTGLHVDRDELLALGAIRMVGTRILVSERFYSLVRPSARRWGISVPIHGIRPIDVAEAPELSTVLPEFLAFSAGTVFVGHGVEVDRQFLERAASRQGLRLPRALWIDTGRVARWLISHHGTFAEAAADRGRFSLEELLAAYAIEPPARHHALADAFATAQLWQRLLYELLNERIETLRDLRLVGLC